MYKHTSTSSIFLYSFSQELRNLQKQVFVKPFPDPDSTPSEAADPTAALWNVKEDGAAKGGEDLGAHHQERRRSAFSSHAGGADRRSPTSATASIQQRQKGRWNL